MLVVQNNLHPGLNGAVLDSKDFKSNERVESSTSLPNREQAILSEFASQEADSLERFLGKRSVHTDHIMAVWEQARSKLKPEEKAKMFPQTGIMVRMGQAIISTKPVGTYGCGPCVGVLGAINGVGFAVHFVHPEQVNSSFEKILLKVRAAAGTHLGAALNIHLRGGVPDGNYPNRTRLAIEKFIKLTKTFRISIASDSKNGTHQFIINSTTGRMHDLGENDFPPYESVSKNGNAGSNHIQIHSKLMPGDDFKVSPS